MEVFHFSTDIFLSELQMLASCWRAVGRVGRGQSSVELPPRLLGGLAWAGRTGEQDLSLAAGHGVSARPLLLPSGGGAQATQAGASGHMLSGLLGVTVTHDRTWVA